MSLAISPLAIPLMLNPVGIVALLERVLGILLSALAVQPILSGLADVGVLTLSTAH